VTCERCGVCCLNNGLIPPLVPGEEAPPWLWALVSGLRREFADVAEDHPCVMLGDDGVTCAIHEYKPAVCREFACDRADEEDLDVLPCSRCGEPVRTVPEGLALCNACAQLTEQEIWGDGDRADEAFEREGDR